MKKILIVVDYQYDFYHPEGTLYVPGAEKLYDNILKIIPDFDGVIFTLDNHPINHCSFKENGGIWPLHCVEGTLGSTVPLEFLKQAKKYEFAYKGTNPYKEEYGALSKLPPYNLIRDFYIDWRTEFVICGLYGDYCVLETLKNVISLLEGTDRISIYLNGIASIDGGTKLNNFIFDNYIKIYDPN